ncbi:MAG: glycosyltransferase family 9 protein [Burkholderiales bacterium]|nr:glycosyltransferase family 9 protein [Burkholderiales bacterium]
MPPERWTRAAPPRRILVVKLSSFGDIVLATTALRAMRRAFPETDLRLAVERRWVPVATACPDVDGVFESPARSGSPIREACAIHRQLAVDRRANGPFDLALDLQGLRRSCGWVYLSGARMKAGHGHTRPGWAFSVPPDRTRHAVRVIASTCERLGVAAADLSPSLRTSAADETRLDAILDHERLPRRDFVLLNPISRWASKSWPVAKAASLASRIATHTGERMIVTGGPEEAGLAASIVRIAPEHAVSLAGRLSLGEALCLFGRARLMVSCDSGPMHAAAALGTPVVALFGPTLPEHTGPWGDGHRVVQAMKPPDHHAYRRADGAGYMDAIGVDPVAQAVLESLRAHPARAADPS